MGFLYEKMGMEVNTSRSTWFDSEFVRPRNQFPHIELYDFYCRVPKHSPRQTLERGLVWSVHRDGQLNWHTLGLEQMAYVK
jgi:hypothetical protein